MTPLLQRIQNAGAEIRLHFLRILNRIAALFFGAIVAVNQFFPQGIVSAGVSLPKWATLPAAVVWLMVVEYAARQPKNTA